MLIGVLSDSHGNAETTARAVAGLLARGSAMLLHLGDICADGVLDELAGHDTRVVFGNCDWDVEAMRRYAERIGVVVDHPMGMLEIDGRRVAFTHGDDASLMRRAIDDGVDYLLHGHTHVVEDVRRGRTRVICPGALHRASRYTCAILDPARDLVRWLEIEKKSPHG